MTRHKKKQVKQTRRKPTRQWLDELAEKTETVTRGLAEVESHLGTAGSEIIKRLLAHGFSMTELGKRTGYSRTYISLAGVGRLTVSRECYLSLHRLLKETDQ